MSIQESVDNITGTVQQKIKEQELPRPVYALAGAVDLVVDRAEEIPGLVSERTSQLREEITALPNTVKTHTAQRRYDLHERIAAAPGQARQSLDSAIERGKSELREEYNTLANRGEKRLSQHQAERLLQKRIDEVSEKVTPGAARAGVATRDAARKARDSETGKKVANAAKRATDATKKAVADANEALEAEDSATR